MDREEPDFYLNRLERLLNEQQDTIRNSRYVTDRSGNVRYHMLRFSALELAITTISHILIKQGYGDEVRAILTGKVLV